MHFMPIFKIYIQIITFKKTEKNHRTPCSPHSVPHKVVKKITLNYKRFEFIPVKIPNFLHFLFIIRKRARKYLNHKNKNKYLNETLNYTKFQHN